MKTFTQIAIICGILYAITGIPAIYGLTILSVFYSLITTVLMIILAILAFDD